MPRVVDEDELGVPIENLKGQEVAPIAEQLGEVPVIKDLDRILDPYAPAPTTEQEVEQGEETCAVQQTSKPSSMTLIPKR